MQSAFQAAFVRRREFFLQLSVRHDDDDCYVVLLHSIPAEQEGHTFARTPGTVEGRIVSMGFTIAPLKPRYRRPGSSAGGGGDPWPAAAGAAGSPECLVTLVLSMDLRGWLGARTLLRYTLPFWSELQRGWVESLLMSLVALGNKVSPRPPWNSCARSVCEQVRLPAHQAQVVLMRSPLYKATGHHPARVLLGAKSSGHVMWCSTTQWPKCNLSLMCRLCSAQQRRVTNQAGL